MGGAELGEGGAEGVFAGLLDAGLEEVDGLEKDGGEDAGAETSYEVEGCLVGRGSSQRGGLKGHNDCDGSFGLGTYWTLCPIYGNHRTWLRNGWLTSLMLPFARWARR